MFFMGGALNMLCPCFFTALVEGIFAQTAFNSSVKKFDGCAMFKSYVLEAFGATTENPGITALEIFFQGISQRFVKSKDFIILHSLSIGWIANN